MSTSSKLFEPFKLGPITLPNRAVMAPLTRNRALTGLVPNPLAIEYYGQRASAGLLVTEATQVSQQGQGYQDTPGIYSKEQIAGWRKVTERVHARGGRIFLQLWHVGRISHTSLQANGSAPVAPSAIRANGKTFVGGTFADVSEPRALELSEIPGIIDSFKQGAANAIAAGFDGVEIHGANGYLLDQFLQDASNKREDRYGGPIENRARLMLEVADAVISVWGASRVGMHLAPRGDAHDMGDSDLPATFGYVARELGKRRIAFICARESTKAPRLGPELKAIFGGLYVANEGFTRENAEAILAAGEADAVAFGKLFIANPDLPRRFALGAPLNRWNSATFYSEGPQGYVDYPALPEAAAAE
jgi:2,4-dienoyl-CoA reductase-like NADH-dependent reductase (Old Yellow Enzyme family)